MKKAIISIISIISIFIIIGVPNEITIKIIALKFLAMFWLWLIEKANNYFIKENRNEKNKTIIRIYQIKISRI